MGVCIAPATPTNTTATPTYTLTPTATEDCSGNSFYCLDGDGGSGCILYTGYCNCGQVNGTPCTPVTPTATATSTLEATPTSTDVCEYFACSGGTCAGEYTCVGYCCFPNS